MASLFSWLLQHLHGLLIYHCVQMQSVDPMLYKISTALNPDSEKKGAYKEQKESQGKNQSKVTCWCLVIASQDMMSWIFHKAPNHPHRLLQCALSGSYNLQERVQSQPEPDPFSHWSQQGSHQWRKIVKLPRTFNPLGAPQASGHQTFVQVPLIPSGVFLFSGHRYSWQNREPRLPDILSLVKHAGTMDMM